MQRLVHLAPQSLSLRIRRGGLRGNPRSIPYEATSVALRSPIFAMPLFADVQVTYQWLRELRTWAGGRRMVAVHFRLPTDRTVYFGRFGQPKRKGPLKDAVADVQRDPWGNEIVVPGPIASDEVIAVRDCRQDIGWQGTPGAHSACVCVACLPAGHPKLKRRLQAAYKSAMLRVRETTRTDEIRTELSRLDVVLERARGRLTPAPLRSLLRHGDTPVRAAVIELLRYFKYSDVSEMLGEQLQSEDDTIRGSVAAALAELVGPTKAYERLKHDALLLSVLCDSLAFSSSDGALPILRRLVDHPVTSVRDAARDALAEWEDP